MTGGITQPTWQPPAATAHGHTHRHVQAAVGTAGTTLTSCSALANCPNSAEVATAPLAGLSQCIMQYTP
jgi:hypothetical protein